MASQYRRRSLMLNTIAKVAQGNPTIITDSSSRRLKKLNVYGQSVQDSTTGAQLLNVYSNGVNNGIAWNCEGSVVTFSGTILEDSVNRINAVLQNEDTYKTGKTYYAKSFTDDVAVDIVVRKQDDSMVYVSEYTVDGTEKELYCRCIINNTINKPGVSINKVTYIAITENVAMSEWEPYTGGKPSPSPDYPQEIISKEVSSIIVSNGASESQTITLPEPITLRGIPVSSDGNVTIYGQEYFSDVICEKDGIIGVKRLYSEQSKQGGWNMKKNTDTDEKFFVQYRIFSVTYTGGNYEGLCNICSYSTWCEITKNKWVFCPTSTGMRIAPPSDLYDDMTAEQLNEMLNALEVPVKIIGRLATPTFEPLPEEVQAQYKALKSYYPNTVIDTGCWNEVTYSAKRGG